MAKFKMDAIEVASSIHKGDFSKLDGKYFEMCDNTNMDRKYTLNQLGTRINQIGDDLAKLTKYVIEGFKQVNERVDNLEKRVEDGFKQVNTRLNYIVKANNLKDLPKNK